MAIVKDIKIIEEINNIFTWGGRIILKKLCCIATAVALLFNYPFASEAHSKSAKGYYTYQKPKNTKSKNKNKGRNNNVKEKNQLKKI